jgi:hypothetical protein
MYTSQNQLGEESIRAREEFDFHRNAKTRVIERADCPVCLLCRGAVEWPSATILWAACAHSKVLRRIAEDQDDTGGVELELVSCAGRKLSTDPFFVAPGTDCVPA